MNHQESMLALGPLFEGRYEVLDRIGEGGFGSIYKARQLTTGQEVAVKVMHLPERGGPARIDSRVARFLREARLCAQLHHPNIVQVIDSGQTADGGLYTVFAFAPGDNLADLLSREGALAPQEARHLMLQVLDALACAHAKGVIHRDLKPSNIMVIPTGARRNALVLDFGIGAIIEGNAAEAHTRLTATNETIGTPGYGAPEQWRGLEPSARSDLFSWGLVFLECLTGTRVYSGASAAEIFYQLLGPDPVPLPAALERHPLGALLRRATKKDVHTRDVSACGLLEALEACALHGLSREGMAGLGRAPAGSADGDTAALLATAMDDEHPAPARPGIDGERRQVTALCCRVGARAAETRALDVEELDELLREALATCVDVARRHRGHPAAMLGDDLLVYFGYPRAEEDDAKRAARAALAILDAVRIEDEQLAARGLRIEVSIGIHTNLVVTGTLRELGVASLAVGATPRFAARLAALAPPGSIAVTAESQRLLRAAFDLEPAAPRSIPGVAAPIDVSRLTRERAIQTPAGTPDGAGTPLVGRDQEVELLLERWRRTRGGAGQCSLITGEPGIGKSRIARELRDRLAREAHTFIEGRCSPDTQNTALFPIVDLLGRALGLDRYPEPSRKRAQLEAQLAAYGFTPVEAMPLFLPLFSLPLGGEYRPLDVSPQRQKELTLNAILSLLFAMAEKQPVLLLVEDLHWTDPTTIELLTQLVREAPSIPMCILLTARPEFSPSFSTTGMLQLHLSRLERPQIEALLTELLGHKALPPTLAEQVANRTDGVPLFVEELIRMLVDTGHLIERDDRYELSAPLSGAEIPGTLRALLTVRLDRLGRAKETAQLAAALGREFSIDVLSAASLLGAAAVQEDLDKLMGAGLVLRKRRLKDPMGVFKHALVRDAAYESLSRGARQKTHARIAEALEEQFPEVTRTRPDLLAHHHAAAQQTPQAIGYGQKAAEQGLQRSAYAEASAHASNVLAWASALPAAHAVKASLAANGVLSQAMMATRGWGDPQIKETAERSTALLRQLDHFSPHEIATLWSLFAYHHTTSHRREARVVAESLVEVAEGSGDPGLRAAASTLLGLTLHPEGNFAEAKAALRRGIELYDPKLHREHGPQMGLDSLVLAKTMLAQLLWLSGDSAEAFELIESGLRWAREVNHIPSIAIGLLYSCQVQQYAGDKKATAAMTGEILTLAEKYGLPAYEGYAAIVHGWATGNEQTATDVVGALAGMGCKLCLSYYGSLVADNLAERGCLDEAIARVDQCLSLCDENDERFYEPELHRRRAMYELRRDPSSDSIRTSLEHAARQAQRQDQARVEALATSELLRRFGDEEGRRARLDSLLEAHPGLREIEIRD